MKKHQRRCVMIVLACWAVSVISLAQHPPAESPVSVAGESSTRSAEIPAKSDVRIRPIQLGLLSYGESDIWGLKFNVIGGLSHGLIGLAIGGMIDMITAGGAGLQIAGLSACSGEMQCDSDAGDRAFGIYTYSVSPSTWFNGIQVSIMNLGNIRGLQIGGVNGNGAGFNRVSGVQASAVNAARELHGVQLGVANFLDLDTKSAGLQLGVLNLVGDVGYRTQEVLSHAGAQVGIINVGYDSFHGFQFGLSNYCENGFARWFPIFNYSAK